MSVFDNDLYMMTSTMVMDEVLMKPCLVIVTLMEMLFVSFSLPILLARVITVFLL